MNLSGFLGWLLVALLVVGSAINLDLIGLLAYLTWAAVLGLPIAFAASWLITAPILKRVMRKNLTWVRAILYGATITSLIALASIVIGRTAGGWLRSLDTSSSRQLGGGDKIQSIDGILTPYGWIQLAERVALFVVAGIAIALVVRAVIGPGNQA